MSLEVQSNTTPRASNAIPRSVAMLALSTARSAVIVGAPIRARHASEVRARTLFRVFLDDPTPEMGTPRSVCRGARATDPLAPA